MVSNTFSGRLSILPAEENDFLSQPTRQDSFAFIGFERGLGAHQAKVVDEVDA
jgi:hypothetical protein